MIDDAFKMGISDAWAYWRMIPKEVQGRLTAFGEQMRRKAEDMDALAWMTGAYAAHGWHDPKHYPKKPNMVKSKKSKEKLPEPDDEPQSEEVIKGVLTAFAGLHNSIVEGGK